MIIHIFGPCNSGKTMLRTELGRLHPEFESWCIDDFRRSIGDGTLDKEMDAQDAFVDKVVATENGLSECSGAGRCALNALFRRTEDVFVVVLDTPADVCRSRITEGKYDGIPFPFDSSDSEVICGIRKDLDSDFFRDVICKGIPVLHLAGDEPMEE